MWVRGRIADVKDYLSYLSDEFHNADRDAGWSTELKEDANETSRKTAHHDGDNGNVGHAGGRHRG